MSRGLTLIEVVAATALLSLIVAVCVPILRGVRRDLDAARLVAHTTPTPGFEMAIDDLLTQRPGLVGELAEHPDGLHLGWTSHDTEHAAVAMIQNLTRAADDEQRSTHCWVSFHAGGTTALRWMRVPDRLLEPRP